MPRQEPERREQKPGHRGVIASLACSACFPIYLSLSRDVTAHSGLGPSIAITNQEYSLDLPASQFDWGGGDFLIRRFFSDVSSLNQIGKN